MMISKMRSVRIKTEFHISDEIFQASCYDADPDVLAVLSNSKDPDVRSTVAANPMTPHHILRILAADPEFYVRIEVYQNQSASMDVREMIYGSFSEDERDVVLYHISINDHTDRMARQIYEDVDSEILDEFLKNYDS